MHQNMASDMLKQAGVDSTVHGFRSSFKGWSMDNNKPHLATEFCMSHTVQNQTEAAYSHTTDVFDQRRELLQQWADYISA